MTLFLQMKGTYSVSQDICQAAVHKGLSISGIHLVTQLRKVFVLWTKAVSPTSYLYSDTRLIDGRRQKLHVSPECRDSAGHGS